MLKVNQFIKHAYYCCFQANDHDAVKESFVRHYVQQNGRLPHPAHCPDDLYALLSRCWLDVVSRPVCGNYALVCRKFIRVSGLQCSVDNIVGSKTQVPHVTMFVSFRPLYIGR